ncbi:LCP family protein [Aestuariimicrobium kwangyangense]|uniref:LCP family protein n=1 Tax=Aestuariimicrobium kwangyangense TaxID=396389 RepID=UPI0003B320D4|nr:LCP family protein [Aestuariimicrobium kwangyangense]
MTSPDDERARLADDGTAEERSAARHQRRKGRRFATVFFSVLLVLLLAGGAVFAYYLTRVSRAIDHVSRNPSIMPSEQGVDGTPRPADPTNRTASGQPMTFVLMGSDSRGSDQGRSDSLMVAYLSGDRKDVYLVSFPRDMWVTVPGKGQAKINAAYAWGGPPLTIATLESMLAVRMQHAAVIDFEGFIKLTDVLGGVSVYNKQASKSDGFTFPEGQITIQGKQALAYVRERHDLQRGDLDRAQRQRDVVQAILKKTMTPETIANPVKFGKTVDTFAACMTVSEDLDSKTIRSVATQLRVNPETGIHSLQAPIDGFGTSKDGQSIDVVDKVGLAELAKAMQTDTMDQYAAKYGS